LESSVINSGCYEEVAFAAKIRETVCFSLGLICYLRQSSLSNNNEQLPVFISPFVPDS